MYSDITGAIRIAAQSLQFCCLIICVYGYSIVWKRRRESFVKKRNLGMILANQGAIALMSIAQAIWLQLQTEEHKTRIHITIAYSLTNTALWLWAWLMLTRTWMIYFTVHWIQDSLRDGWRFHINKRDSDPSWFLQNFQKYGQMPRMLGMFGLLMFVAFAIFESNTVYNCLQEEMDWFSFGGFITALIIGFVGPLGFYIFLIRNTPSFPDHLRIQWESNMIAKCMICLGVSFVLLCIALVTVRSEEIFDLVRCIASFVWAIITILLAITSSICIVPKEDLKNSVSSTSNTDKRALSPRMSRDAILRDTLKDRTSLDSFMLHLAKSYSMEILLSLIEFVQYREWLNETLNFNDTTNETKVADTNQSAHSKGLSIEFPDNIIVSEIIENDESELIKEYEWSEEVVQIQRARFKAHRLYEKYISEERAGYEINISHAERRRLRALLEDPEVLLASDIDVNALNTLFDKCEEQMIQYLRDSVMRFKRSEERISTIGTVDHLTIKVEHLAASHTPAHSGSWSAETEEL